MKKLLVSLMLLLGIALGARSQGANDAAVIRQINSVAAGMKTMQCDFVQTKYLKMLNDKMVSRGKMYYQQSDKLRWEYTAPYKYTFVLNGSSVLLSKGSRNDVINVNQSKFFKEIARIMMNSVVGKCLTEKKDFRTTISQTGSEWVATLVPQRSTMRQMFQKIVLRFSKQRKMVSTVEIVEKKGDRTVIQLTNVKTNTPVNAKVFKVN